MILPDSLPRIEFSDLENLRQLAMEADCYLNEPRTTLHQKNQRTAEVVELLNDEVGAFEGRCVILGGIIKRAAYSKTYEPALKAARHLERTKLKGTLAGIIIADLESDYGDIEDKSPRQDQLLQELRARAQGRLAVGYLVDINKRIIRSDDFLQRSADTVSALGLVTSSQIALEDYDLNDDEMFGIESEQENENLRILAQSTEHTQAVADHVGEQLMDSADKLATLLKHAKKLNSLSPNENYLELAAVADYLMLLAGEGFLGFTYRFDDELPISLQNMETGQPSFKWIDPEKNNSFFVSGIGVSQAFHIVENGTAIFLPKSAFYLLAHPVIDGYIDISSVMIPLEQLAGVGFTKVDDPANLDEIVEFDGGFEREERTDTAGALL